MVRTTRDAGAAKRSLIVGGVVVAVVLFLFILPAVGSFNKLVGLREGVDGQWAQVENVYQRRTDLIPNLVATVQGSANFERETLLAVTNARSRVSQVQQNSENLPDNPEALQQFQQAQDTLTAASRGLINIVVERYPDIKSTQNFRDLQSQIEGSENRISTERGRYNEKARDYNTARSRFPASITAGMFGFDRKAYFTSQPGSSTPPDVKDLLNPTPSPGR